MNRVWMVLRHHWILAAAIGLALVIVSLALLAAAFSPVGEPLRLQATLAPTWFVPPGAVP